VLHAHRYFIAVVYRLLRKGSLCADQLTERAKTLQASHIDLTKLEKNAGVRVRYVSQGGVFGMHRWRIPVLFVGAVEIPLTEFKTIIRLV